MTAERNVCVAAFAAASLVASLGGCATTVVESGSVPPPAASVTTIDTTLDTVPPTAALTEDAPDLPAPALESATGDTTLATASVVSTIVPLSGWDAVDQYLDVTIVRGGSAAASIAVLQDGVLQHAAAYGERIANEAADPLDRFRVASISKTIATIAALQLVEDGTLSLDEPLGAAVAASVGVDAPADGVSGITLRDLLTHRSGFAQYESLFFDNEVGSCPEAAAVGMTRSLQSTPGTSFRYSNLNFCVVGLALELATGKPYAQVVAEQVLAPLGISDMATAGTFELGPHNVEHRSDAGRNYMEVLGAAGAWVATPADLVSILNSLDPSTPGVKLLDADTLQMMQSITVTPPTPADPVSNDTTTTTVLPPPPPTSGYGMGLMIFDAPLGDTGAATYGHTGTLESTHAMMVRRSDGLTWAITVSGDYPGSTRDLAKIVDNALLLGGFIDGTYIAIPPPLAAP